MAIYKLAFQGLSLPLELEGSVLNHHLLNKEHTREAVMDTFILEISTRTSCLVLQENRPGRKPGRAEDTCLSKEVQVTR